jgi:hypothetical protein
MMAVIRFMEASMVDVKCLPVQAGNVRQSVGQSRNFEVMG